VKGYKSVYHFEYTEPRGRKVIQTIEYHRNQEPVKQKRLLKIAELNRLKDYFEISQIENYADLYDITRIKNTIDYYFHALNKKLEKDKSAALDENYLASIFSHPQWYAGMLTEREKATRYMNYLKDVNGVIAEIVREKKYSTKINFDNFEKPGVNGQLKLSSIKDVKLLKQTLRVPLRTMQQNDYNRLKEFTDFVFTGVKYNSVFLGRNHNSIREDIQLTLLQAGYRTINVNE
jgi:hypothetical protein